MQNSAPLLSVVVAVYNGEAFLDQFFTCLVNQHIDSMEVIIVNDGSTDRSMQIVKKWREKLPQMQVIEQPNQGVSIARNTGLAVATGQYLSFPDIDDVFKPGMYQRLLDMAVTQNLDVATCNGNYVWENNKKPSRPIFPEDKLASTGVLNGACDLAEYLSSRFYSSARLPFRAWPAPSGYPVDD